MAIGQLVVRLGLDAADYVQGMTKAEAQAQRFGQNVGTGIKTAALGAAAGLTAIAAAGAAAFNFLNNQVEAIANFQNLSEKIGDTAENLASLKTASDVSGVSMDSIAAASIKLTAALSKTDEDGKGAAQAIKALGLDFESFKKLSPVEQIEAVSKAMAGFEDAAGKTEVAVALWGKSGADMIPLLNDLANGSERQITLTNDQIKAADDFSKSMARLASDFEAGKNKLTSEFLPVMSALINQLTDLKKYAIDGSDGLNILTLAMGALKGVMFVLKTVFETVVIVATDIAFVFKGVGREIGAVAAQLAALATLDFNGFSVIGQAVKEDAAKARKDLDEFQKKFLTGNAAAAGGFKPSDNYGAGGGKPALAFSGLKPPKATGGGVPKVSDADRYLKSLENQIEATKKLTVEETLLSAIRKGDLGNITPAMQAQLLLRAQELDAIKARGVEEAKNAEQNKRDSESALAMLMRGRDEYNKRMEEGQRLTNSVKTEQERVNELTEYYNSLMSDPNPIITLETYNRLMAQLKGKTEENNTSFINFQATAAQAVNSLADGLTDAIMQGKSLGDVFKNVVKQLAAMVLKALIFKAIQIGLNAVSRTWRYCNWNQRH